MSRRRSIYKLPKLRLKQKTITAVGTLVAFGLAILSLVTVATHSQTLNFWRDFLTENLGWAKILSPIVFTLVGLSLTRARFKIAQLNVLLGFILVLISFVGITGGKKLDKAGSIR